MSTLKPATENSCVNFPVDPKSSDFSVLFCCFSWSFFFFSQDIFQNCRFMIFFSTVKTSEDHARYLLGSLSMHVFETGMTTGRGHFAFQDSGVSQIFIPSISNGEKILANANAVV